MTDTQPGNEAPQSRPRVSPAEEAKQRAAYARQVIAGSQLRSQPQGGTIAAAPLEHNLAQDQVIYLVILGFLLVLGLVLYLVFSFGVASIIFLLLAFALFAGYFLF